jgi:hypothetical protein
MAASKQHKPSSGSPDSHDFAKRPYDLVKEFTIALGVVVLLTTVLAAVFSSPDDKAITLRSWATNAPGDVAATATAELAGLSPSATYGAPYNTASQGQNVLGVPLQRWGGVGLPIDSTDLVIQPLTERSGDETLTGALDEWNSATAAERTDWATAYSEALAQAPEGNPAEVADGSYGPVPVMTQAFLDLARSGGLEGSLTASSNFYGGDQTRSMLLLSDGSYLEEQAVAQDLGGDQWGMMNETGAYPGQPWMWLYTFWYQVKPFSTSENADTEVWALMMVLTLGLMFLPLIPGLRDIPRWIPVHRLIWRDYYRSHKLTPRPRGR